MDFGISTDQKEYQKEIIEFARNNLNDDNYLEEFSFDMWKKVSDFGILGVRVGEEYGGLNESNLTAALILEALGYACKNSGFIFTINNHIWVAQNLIYFFGTELLKNKYVADMVAGKKIGCMAITEAEAGSDAFAMSTKAEEKEDYYILNGSKIFISNGPIADIFIVFAVTESEPKKK